MIAQLRHKGLGRFWTHTTTGKSWRRSRSIRLDRILDLLDEIEELPKDLLPYPGLAIHALKGDLAGFWECREGHG